MARRRSTSKFKNQQGFTIIEMVMTLFILGVVFLIYNAAANTMVLNRNMKDQEAAFRIASAEVDTLRANGYSAVPASGSISDTLLSVLPGSAAENLAVSDYDPKTKQITVTVSWYEPGNTNQRNIVLTTLITDGGLGQ